MDNSNGTHREGEAFRTKYYVAPAPGAGQRAGAGSDRRAPHRKTAPKREIPARRQPEERVRPARPRKLRVGNRNRLLAFLGVVAVLLIIGGVFLHAQIVVGFGRETFYDGVSVNGISLSGMTLSQGLEKVRTLTDEWLHRTHTFTWNGRSWDFSAADIDASIAVDQKVALAYNFGHVGGLFQRKKDVLSLREKPVSYVADIVYNEEKMEQFIESIAQEVDVAPVNAQIVVDVDNPVVVSESSNGLALDRDDLRHNIISLLNTGEGSTQLKVDTAYPNMSTQDAYACTGLIVTYQTDTTFRNMYSTANVRLALSNFDGFCLEPGEQFSFNDIVGDRTIERGYTEALEYAGSNTQMGIGGGVCQASTTLYGALLKAGMTQVSRGNHTMTVSYVDPGIDAAVAYGTKDLLMRNDTRFPVFVYTDVSHGFATVYVYGHRPQYRIEFESEILEVLYPKDIYTPDEEGTHAYFTTDHELKVEGKNGCRSQSYLVYYDWDTGELVKRTELNRDYYYPLNYEYYVGVHMAGGD